LATLLPTVGVLVAACTLAVLGIRGLNAEAVMLRAHTRRDQSTIVRLVSKRLSEQARQALRDLQTRCRNRKPDGALERRFLAAQPLSRHIFVIEEGELAYPPLPRSERELRGLNLQAQHMVSALGVRRYIERLRENRRLGLLLQRGQKAEYQRRVKRARLLYERVVKGDGRPAALALLGVARLHRKGGQSRKAAAAYGQLRGRFAGRRDEMGIDYALLADSGLVELDQKGSRRRLHDHLIRGLYRTSSQSRRFYLQWIIEKARVARDPSYWQMAAETRQLLLSERFGRRLLRHGLAELFALAGTTPRSVALDSRTLLVLLRSGRRVLGYALNEAELRRRVALEQKAIGPSGRGMSLALWRAGQVTKVPYGELLQQRVLDSPLGFWTVGLRRSTADPLIEAEKRAEARQLGLVLGLLVVLSGGLFFTYRGVKRETDLARLKSDFVSTVSHELKTPLTSIRMYAEMLQQGIATDEDRRQRYQRVIIRESERLGQLITNVLDFSRVERGTRRYELLALDATELCAEAVATFKRLADGEKVSILSELPAGAAKIHGDREAAMTSLLNLLSNAAKYSRDDPRIELSLEERGDQIAIRVSDHGIGIPLTEQKKIFRDFYRAAGAREAGVEGTGLGLALVRRHMSACGGRVEVTSKPGEGSTFTLWFARAPSIADDRASREPRRALGKAGS
jgi:signal transduction histidine kinase